MGSPVGTLMVNRYRHEAEVASFECVNYLTSDFPTASADSGRLDAEIVLTYWWTTRAG